MPAAVRTASSKKPIRFIFSSSGRSLCSSYNDRVPGSSFRVCRKNVTLRRRQLVACRAALSVVIYRRVAVFRGWRELSRRRIKVEHPISPSVRVRESLAVLHNELNLRQVARHNVRHLRRKRSIRYRFRPPLYLHNLRPLGESLAIAGNALLISLDHHRIGDDRPDHLRAFADAGANHFPLFVSLDLREGEPARYLQRVLVLLLLSGAGTASHHGEHQHNSRGHHIRSSLHALFLRQRWNCGDSFPDSEPES